MKKLSNLILIASMFSLLWLLSACKDDSVAPEPTIDLDTTDIADDVPNVLSSPSFDVLDLVDTATGNYVENADQTKGLKCKFTIKNKSLLPVSYYVTIEKVRMKATHYASFCIGECVVVKGEALQATRYLPNGYTPGSTAVPAMRLDGGKSTDPNIDSYIAMFSGQLDDNAEYNVPASKAKNMLRVTYINAYDETDFVRFKCYWDFKE